MLECASVCISQVALANIGMAKAFDRVSHRFLLSILPHIYVGTTVLEGLNLRHKYNSTRLIVHNILSDKIYINASVRQVFSLSSFLFALFLEPYA